MRRLLLCLCLLVSASGCGDAALKSRRYRAEQLLWEARRAEQMERLKEARPDSTALLRLHDGYARLKAVFPPPFPSPTGADSTTARDFVRAIGTAALSAASSAMEAGRPDLALADAQFVIEHAVSDSGLQKRAYLMTLAAFQRLGQVARAESVIVVKLDRFRPVPPRRPGEEDALLSVPDAWVAFRREAGDDAGVRYALERSEEYYRKLLREPINPALEAQVRARLIRVLFERERWPEVGLEIDRLEELVKTVDILQPLTPEVLYSKAKLRALRDADPTEAVHTFRRIATDFPASPFAARSLLDAGVTLERHHRYLEALEEYRTAAARYPRDLMTAPTAVFRQGIILDRLDRWDEGKRALEEISITYPTTRAALEAPLAVAERYVRRRQWDAAKSAYRKAIGTYQSLIQRDTTFASVPLYYFNIFRTHIILDEKPKALAILDGMLLRSPRHPIMAQALVNGSFLAKDLGETDRARSYLERFLTTFPKSPQAGEVREVLRGLKPPA